MIARRVSMAILVVGSTTAFVVSALTFAGFMFGIGMPARFLGGVAFGSLGVWFLLLRHRVKGQTT